MTSQERDRLAVIAWPLRATPSECRFCKPLSICRQFLGDNVWFERRALLSAVRFRAAHADPVTSFEPAAEFGG